MFLCLFGSNLFEIAVVRLWFFTFEFFSHTVPCEEELNGSVCCLGWHGASGRVRQVAGDHELLGFLESGAWTETVECYSD